ncbi:MAG TPA: hypothetical protein P5572_07775 [Phycisphaerae bacterium]|nr:hypothetical protein [Phycisphaerae bacterium]
MSTSPRSALWPVFLLVFIAIGMPGCASPEGDGPDPTPPPDTDYLAPEPATYTLRTEGAPRTLATVTVTTAGGVVTGSDGFAIDVPADALPAQTHFVVTADAVTSHDFPQRVTVVTPLYAVTGLDAVAGDFMTLTMPLVVSTNGFPAVVSWDEASGRAEILPLIDYDGAAAKVVTRHFSVFVGVELPIDFLMSLDYETGFRAGFDDWQFGNFRSWTSSGGVCLGMTVSSLWYYATLKEQNLRGLRNQYRYGQYGSNIFDTPSFTEDDDVGRRLVSVVQRIADEERWNWYYIEKRAIVDGRALTTDELMLLEVATALVVEEAPQFLAVDNTAGTAAHAITCCGIKGSTLLCVDPNHPGETKSLRLDATTHAWASYDGSVQKVDYVAKTSASVWEQLPDLWNQMKIGTIGDAMFPEFSYVIGVHDEENYVEKTEADLASVNSVDSPNVSFFVVPENLYDYTVYELKGDNIKSLYSRYDAKGILNPNDMASVPLTPHEPATFGILVNAAVAGQTKDMFKYVDFKWFTVEYAPDEPGPDTGPLNIPDPCLAQTLTDALASLGLDLTAENLAQLGMVSLYAKGITDLTGLEHCTNLVSLDAAYNHIADVTPLAGLTRLEFLRLDGNIITDLSPLAGLANLTFLRIQHQQGDVLTSLDGLESLTAIDTLFADGNAITSIAPLASLTALERVTLSANAVSDLSPLADLPHLASVDASRTYVADISPMADSPALAGLALNVFCTYVDPNCDPQNGVTTQCDVAATLEAAGATVTLPDPTRACTPGPDGTDPFPSPVCEL